MHIGNRQTMTFSCIILSLYQPTHAHMRTLSNNNIIRYTQTYDVHTPHTRAHTHKQECVVYIIPTPIAITLI